MIFARFRRCQFCRNQDYIITRLIEKMEHQQLSDTDFRLRHTRAQALKAACGRAGHRDSAERRALVADGQYLGFD